jgi:hypothetical protein
MATTAYSTSPQVRQVKEKFPDDLTTRELARHLGRTQDTVQRWRIAGVLEPSHYVESGKVRIWLYDKASVRKAERLVKTLKPGRKAGEDYSRRKVVKLRSKRVKWPSTEDFRDRAKEMEDDKLWDAVKEAAEAAAASRDDPKMCAWHLRRLRGYSSELTSRVEAMRRMSVPRP